MRIIEPIRQDPVIKKRKLKKYLKKLKKTKIVNGLYLLTLATSDNNLIDIVTCKELYRSQEKYDPVILGLAMKEEAAFELLRKIIEEVYLAQSTITKASILKELTGNDSY